MNTASIEGLGSNDKVTRLIEYLIALAQIDRKIIRDVEDSAEYKRVLWLYEIPHDKRHCFVKAWGEEDESEEGSWISVEKFREPLLPPPPDKCKDWIDSESLKNINEIPELRQVAEFTRDEPDPETGEVYQVAESCRLEDFPEVQEAWEAYIENRWLPWRDLRRQYEAVSNVYSRLFQIYQDQQRLGEQYELIVSFGLLTWLTPSGHTVRRHLISATASLEFQPYLGKFTVGPSPEGAQVRIEFDMLDPEHHPEKSKQLSDDGIKNLGDNPWERSALDPLLKGICNSLPYRGDGEYYCDGLEPIDPTPSEKPVVEFAPALILRKRSRRSLETVLLRIKKQLDSGLPIPRGFLALCESVEEGEGGNGNGEKGPFGGKRDPEIYFPLPANEEQFRIVDFLDRQRGVLVQGPPGTGKSHTIANLVCHLLATGKRVLITAKTPRALKVLHVKLPREIRPLCISLLGQGSEERQSLEQSVRGILTKLDKPDGPRSQERVQQLERQIREKRKEKVEIDNRLMAVRESETFSHCIADGTYQGTAAAIARRLREEREHFSWLEDSVAPTQVLPLNDQEIDYLRKQILELDEATECELKLSIPDPDHDLPDGNTVRALFAQERAALEKTSATSERLRSEAGRALEQASNEIIEPLKASLEKLAAEADAIRQRPAPWISRAVNDILTDSGASWRELLHLSGTRSCGLRDLATKAEGHEILIPHRMDRTRIKIDAEAVKDHLEGGGRMGFWLWKPKPVKEHGDFLETVKVDGSRPRDLQSLELLIDYLDLDQRIKQIWELWRGKVRQPIDSFSIQIAKIEELNKELYAIVQLGCLKESAAETIGRVSGFRGPKWEDSKDLKEVVETCLAVHQRRTFLNIRKELQKIEHAIALQAAKAKAHPISRELLNSFKKRDFEGYTRLTNQALDLINKAELVCRKNEIMDRLEGAMPKLVNGLRQHTETEQWAERLKNLTKAWDWAKATAWLDEFLAADSESLERNSVRLGQEIRDDLTQLAAVKAWRFCLDRMRKHNLAGHLASWEQAMKRYGKGTGKYAHVHLRDAQRHLNECRQAVPAWIMPLHRVFETVPASSGVFDSIIVDEASQCGPESLPLLYLGNKVLIVGDDKQISPEAVGIEKAKVLKLIKDFLPDFRYRDSFGLETSLFDHARIRFGNPIALREHFRCMPEIIRFSDDLCYKTSSLLPLRQYPPNRLDPLKVECVTSGYREGSGAHVINRPEAEKLVETVAQCCRDERYTGLTMGVIVLQGEAQAGVIEDLLLTRVGAEEMAKRCLICGNPYSFQGDERDVIFLSMVAAANARIGTLSKAPDERRFNVAASRARDQAWLFHSDIYNQLSEGCLRRRLLDHFHDRREWIDEELGGVSIEELRERALRANRRIEKPPGQFDSWFEVDVALDIANRGYRVVSQFEFGGKRIDLVVQGWQAQLAVECYGDHWHGAEQFQADMQRQRKLERCGWHFFVVRESFYRAAPDEALRGLWKLLDRMGINGRPSTRPEQTGSQNADSKDNQFLAEPVANKTSQTRINIERKKTTAEAIADIGIIPNDKSNTNPKHTQTPYWASRELIEAVIVEILREDQSNSHRKDDMSEAILNRWSITDRNSVRKQFKKKVNETISGMVQAGYVVVDGATKIKLGGVPYPGLDSDHTN